MLLLASEAAGTAVTVSVIAANISVDDHPIEKLFLDRIESVTVDSVFRWLQRAGLGRRPVELRLHVPN